ncbi:hypothetical protein BDZ90DRAFT_233288 [Jaminaea rosea]|uniref:Tubulin nucleotide-binding domain-like protein n=1 Tax=Jaminaea rosea TaxID=1569628 RepID=A0A316UP69_9BASI|nr:hypothetical protein BDZ90DRAFT_233288 [Jaminaea rosea]PWN26141.1 hypothetical protein BDZ90DRAFT_233288 [Jaminaea rosea]
MPPSSTRELLHISYGSPSSHLTTQFFNTQHAYFDYSASSSSAPPPLIDHDISWQEGVEPGSGRERYTPRWLGYDTREGFEGLRLQDDVGDDDEEEEQWGEGVEWSGGVERMRIGHEGKARTTPFRALSVREAQGEEFDWDREMQREMDDDDEYGYDDEGDEEDQPAKTIRSAQDGPTTSTISCSPSGQPGPSSRYRRRRPWSHYLLFSPHPRSLIPIHASGNLPLNRMPLHEDAASAAAATSSSSSDTGVELFSHFESGYTRSAGQEAEQDTFDTTLRSSMEACDRPQGFNLVLSASDAWAGFATHQLEFLADEYPKLGRVAWAVRSGRADWQRGHDEEEGEEEGIDPKALQRRRARAMNETLALLLLSESVDLYVPLAAPEGEGATQTQTEREGAALLASHFETATLGARLRDSPTSLSKVVDQLTWRGGTPLASLGGEVPQTSSSFSSSSAATTSTTAVDPIDALLASRGYTPAGTSMSNRSGGGGRRHPEQEAINARRAALREGAERIDARWRCFSEARPYESKGTAASTQSSSSTSPPWSSSTKPFAMHAISRLGPSKPFLGRDRSFAPAPPSRTDIVQHWLHPDEEERNPSPNTPGPQLSAPWARLLSTPLAQPTHAAMPRTLREGSSSSSTAGPAPLSALYCSPRPTLSHLSHARKTLLAAVRGHSSLAAWGVGEGASEGRVGGRDGLKDLLERVEELRGGYEDGGAADEDEEDEGGKDTDEDWEDGAGEDEDGLDWS